MKSCKLSKLERQQVSLAQSMCDTVGVRVSVINGQPKRLQIGPYKLYMALHSSSRRTLDNLASQVRQAVQSLHDQTAGTVL